jgi:cobalt/nickel transport system ATP-binding protein
MLAVELKDLSFAYPDGRIALTDVSLAIEAGENVGLVGPNGAGKSTLLMHLNGILPEIQPTRPSVFINDVAISRSSLLQVRREVGLLFQDPDDQIFCPTVYEDVAFGPRQLGLPEEEVRSLVREALTKVGLGGYDERSPHHLSSGEKQRVCLAGLLVCQPKVLALDEPSRGLDPRGKRQLVALLQSISTTKIIATHDLELVVRLCPRAIVLDAGKVVGDGPALTLFSDEEFMLAHGLEKPHILRHVHPH